MEALLVLEDGMVFRGRSFGALGERTGEVVFNTAITGYQEIITDPSCRGQMVVMTYPHIGNTGINEEDSESGQPHVRALIVREVSSRESNWRARQTLDRYLREHEIMALTDIDTRALTRHVRQFGALRGVVSTVDLDPDSLRGKALVAPTTSDEDLVAEVTCNTPYEWTERVIGEWRVDTAAKNGCAKDGCAHPQWKVVAYDCGIKHSILRQLVESGCQVTVVPAQTAAADVLALKPDGVFLSNGPGDPEMVPYTLSNLRSLLGQVPIFGICLGHQLLGMALGGSKFKLKFGHHGGNHPVKDLRTGQIAITTQNHNFAIDPDSLPAGVEVTHLSLYDHTLEGLRHRELSVFGVQNHPEAAPGPHDANPLFGEFVELMAEWKGN